jgi:hypothetical protein
MRKNSKFIDLGTTFLSSLISGIAFLAVVILSLTGCAADPIPGSPGPAGPAGAIGPAGPTGAAGPTGPSAMIFDRNGQSIGYLIPIESPFAAGNSSTAILVHSNTPRDASFPEGFVVPVAAIVPDIFYDGANCTGNAYIANNFPRGNVTNMLYWMGGGVDFTLYSISMTAARASTVSMWHGSCSTVSDSFPKYSIVPTTYSLNIVQNWTIAVQ